MSYDSTDKGCDGCDYSWRYFLNGLKPCPDAYSDVSNKCDLYNHEKKDNNNANTRVKKVN